MRETSKCIMCGIKPTRRGSRFCTNHCAANWLYANHTTTYATSPANEITDIAEELSNDGSEWCSSCRAWVFPDESRHLAHPYDSPSLPFWSYTEY